MDNKPLDAEVVIEFKIKTSQKHSRENRKSINVSLNLQKLKTSLTLSNYILEEILIKY